MWRGVRGEGLKLHTKIIIGLILGVIFGSIFAINPHKISLTSNAGTETITDWAEFTYQKKDSVVRSFNSKDQLAIIKYFKAVKDKKELKIKINDALGNVRLYENITAVEKVTTIGVWLKPIGDIFIRLLNMIAIPLIFASLIVGAASLSDFKHIVKIGGKTLAFFAMTAVVSITIGLVLANIISPGKIMDSAAKEQLIAAYQDDAKSSIEQNVKMDLVDFLVNIVPKNPFKALGEGDFLQIVFFAILIGIFLVQIPKDKSEPVIKFFDGITDSLILLVEKVMIIAPYAVFTLIAATVAEFGFEIIKTLLWYSLTVLLGLLIVTFVEYPVLLKIFTLMKVRDFFKAQKQVMAVAFSTSSSAATLPITMDACEKKLGIPNKIASFVLPIGNNINKDGTAVMQVVAAIFIAQVYGFELTFTQQLTILLTTALAALGTASVPGMGLLMLIIVLKSVGLPEEGIALIIGVDRILDMSRTVPNVLADSLACVVISDSEGELGEINVNG
jgi:Na+/H+-dicarboxylate symporter